MRITNFNSKGKLISICLVAAVAVSVSGCISSTKPLFPAPGFKSATPAPPGHYLKFTTVVPKGKSRVLRAELEGVVLTQENQTYGIQEIGDFGPTTHAQLFGSDKNPGSFIAQIASNDLYVYRNVQIFKGGAGFNLWSQNCSDIPAARKEEISKKGLMTSKCDFNSAASLDRVLRSEDLWLTSDVEAFRPVAAKDLIKTKDLEPKLLVNPLCAGAVTAQASGAGSAARPAPAGGHMKILSSSPSKKKGKIALAIEASGNTPGNWAWITGWKESVGQIDCRPDFIIKVLALRPEKSVIKEGNQSKPLIENVCKQRSYAGGCAPVSEAISAYRAEGYKIILQGQEYVLFGDRVATRTGRVITVMGKEGRSPRFLILATGSVGETALLLQD